MTKAKKVSKKLAGRTGEVSLEATVELARVRVRIEELLQYTEGSLIQTDRVSGEPVVLLVGGEPFATGEVVTISEKFGMRVVELTNG